MIRDLAAFFWARLGLSALLVVVLAFVCVFGASISGEVLAHPDHPGDEDVYLQFDVPTKPPSVESGTWVSISGHGFEANLTVSVFGVRGLLHSDVCPSAYDPSNANHFSVLAPGDDPIVSQGVDLSFTHRFFVGGSKFSEPGIWGFCGVGGDGTFTSPVELMIGQVPYIEGSDVGGVLHPGETVVFTGGNFAPNTGVTVFAVDGSGGPVSTCQDHDVASLSKVRGRTNSDGDLLPVPFKLDDDPFVSSLQWYFCGFDDHGEYASPYHVHVKRFLRSNKLGPEGFYRLEYGDPDADDYVMNEVQIVPGLPAGASVLSVEVGSLTVSVPVVSTDVDRLASRFSISVGTGSDDADRVVEGRYEMRVYTDDSSLGEDGVIRGFFDVGVRSLDYFLWVNDARYESGQLFAAYPGQTLSLSGFGFAPSQSGLIFMVQNTSNEGCPEYSPSIHVVRNIGVAGDDLYFPSVEFELSEDVFDEVGAKWYFCGVDGAGQDMVPDDPSSFSWMGEVEIEIVHTLRAVDSEGDVYLGERGGVLVIGEENTVRIVPPLRAGHTGVDWDLGLQGKGTSDTPFDGNDTIVEPDVLAGLYTMTAFVSSVGADYEIDALFRVVRPGAVRGDFQLTLDAGSRVHPYGALLVSGSGFEAGQTVLIYAVPGLGSECPNYDRTVHASVSEIAGSSGELEGVEFSLDDDDFAMEWNWRICGTDGSGNVSNPPLVVRMNRVLLFVGGRSLLLNGQDNVVRISPALPAGSLVNQASLGPFPMGSSLPLVHDQLGSAFTISLDVELGIYTLVVAVRVGLSGSVETVRALVEVIDGSGVLGDHYVSAGVDTAKPGDTLVFTGAGFAPNQTVVVYGFPAGVGEICPSYDPDVHDLSFRVGADSGGMLPSTDFELSDPRFSTVFSWHFCAVGGDGR